MKNTNQVTIGEAFEELSFDEMQSLQGSGDIVPASSIVSITFTLLSLGICGPISAS